MEFHLGETLTLSQARRLALHHQGLTKPDRFGRGINGVERAIHALRYVQIDTISVVNRAHHHVLQSRVGNYQEDWLNRLLSERRSIFEYWHHAAAYLPMEDYRFYRPIMLGFKKHKMRDRKTAAEVLKRIQAEGPMQSKDFEAPAGVKSGGWWEWKPAKLALEELFLSGDLMVTERRGFQKVFDLTERVLPDHVDTSTPTQEERAQFYVKQMLNAQGIARAQDIAYMRHIASRWEKFKMLPGIQAALDAGVASGDIVTSEINGDVYYAKTEHVEALPARISRNRIQILNPFDNIIINRSKLEGLFDFRYQIECYVPEPKRQFGYYTLPLLLGDTFIGRIDCKAHRKNRVLIVNNLWLEPKTRVSTELADLMQIALEDFARCHDCVSIELKQVDDKQFFKLLAARLNQ